MTNRFQACIFLIESDWRQTVVKGYLPADVEIALASLQGYRVGAPGIQYP